MGWFHQVKNPKLKNIKKLASNTPVGLWKKCNSCGEILQTDKLEENLNVCPLCDYHYRISAYERIAVMTDENSFDEISPDLISNNPLNFQDKMPYVQRLQAAIKNTGIKDSTVCGTAAINGQQIALAVMDFRFMGGSMGVVTGEKVALAMDIGFEKKIPVIVVSCSGGARMQEGILSLMQMAKTSASRARLKTAGIPYISFLTDPTTGGCAASFAMLGDINVSEPRALIGFAGPRVIEQSIRQTLPEGFQRSEFLKEHGFIDRIIHRRDLKAELSFFVKMFAP
ncbi:MAG TPA: acetyl-CoA carboxylase, carboxyltransferase subunit beta [Bacteriovoracaceae bacterium]|nr:acetyl-CoA carboxylase, carboxyltransferase subunit beta [Bacteriovoracaceae bacterium]